MHIDVPETFTSQPMEFNKSHHLFMLHLGRPWERLKQGEYLRPVPDLSAGEFADDEWVTDHISVIQQTFEPCGALPQMRHPDGAIDEDHPTLRPFFGEESPSIVFPYRPIRRVACRFPC